MNEPRTLPFDIWVVALDETKYWNLPADLMQHIEGIYGIYMFDKNQVTHCCEITPSYWLEPIDQQARFKSYALDDATAERIDETIRGTEQEGMYMHCRDVDQLLESLKDKPFRVLHYGGTGVSFEDSPEEEQWERLRENFRCNAPL